MNELVALAVVKIVVGHTFGIGYRKVVTLFAYTFIRYQLSLVRLHVLRTLLARKSFSVQYLSRCAFWIVIY